ncbi:MAG TPA: Na(+)/H(+) antiporter NhaA, partial [Allosphingosinicella sp.]
ALAFPGNADLIEEAKIGVLLGSLASAITGFLILRFSRPAPDHGDEEAEQDVEIDADGDVERVEERTA